MPGVRKIFKSMLVFALLSLPLTGCMYRGDVTADSGMSAAVVEDSIAVIQHAVDKYHKKTLVLPIKNSTDLTPLYQRNVIDFNRLKADEDLASIPKGAFESGGHYLFVIVDAETHPTVKALDLITLQKTGDIQKAVNQYVVSHQGLLPKGSRTAPGFYYIDYKKLHMDTQQIQSPFTGNYLPFLLHEGGDVVVDYGLDIAQFLKKPGIKVTDPGMDLRKLLVSHSDFVPVKSYPYHLVNGEPQVQVR